MKIFVFLLASLSLTFVNTAPVPSPEANPEPCLEIIFGILQLFLTTPRPRRREFTTPDDVEPEPDPDPEPTTEPSSTDSQPTEGNSSGESAEGPSVDGGGTTEGNPDDIPNEVIPRNADTLKRLRKPKKKQNDWWFGGIKW
ncbi:uncharacterized protein LOC119079401 [Bradysia coprophila]|uniref:uncharacterized protein LOC119079401 n=1 Tax=Bradysia coprophila TaxID=38358 RepID=UPI00187D95CD|nr:uncharacterized protein LOC119079401 [Bradysia coprophila]XP_037043184.1 uncharacterized protein LOC119079401 [Bradysia coprophila]